MSPPGQESHAHKAFQRILLVEDNALVRKVQSKMLRTMSVSVDVAINGLAAVQKTLCPGVPSVSGISHKTWNVTAAELREKGARTPYALILMDVNMPIMNGIEVSLPTVRTLPLLAYTAAAPHLSHICSYLPRKLLSHLFFLILTLEHPF
jgi:CheY-like chemotaxis protein